MPPMPQPGPRRDCTCPKARHDHGTNRAYVADRCRCFYCQRANSRWQKRKRHLQANPNRPAAFVPSIGVARRLQALAAVGWASGDLAPLLGTYDSDVMRWRRAERPMVTAAVHARVAALYDELWDKPPTGRYIKKVINLARREGYAPPLAWDDDRLDDPTAQPFTLEDETLIDQAAIDMVLAGRRVPSLTWFERRALVRQGKAAGLTADQITELLRGIPIGKAPGSPKQAQALAEALDRTRVAA